MEETKKRNQYLFLPMLKRLVENINQKDKKLYGLFAVYTICASTYPFFAVILPKVLLEELMLFDKASVSYLMVVCLGYFVLASMVGFLKEIIHGKAYSRITFLRIQYIADTFEKLVTVAYPHREDSRFFEKNMKAFQATTGNNNGVEAIYHKLFEMPATAITIILMIFFVGLQNPFILVGLFIQVVVSMIVSKLVHNYRYSMKEVLAKTEHKKAYYKRITHDFGYGKDIRIYDLQHSILDNYHGEIMKYVNVIKKIKNKEYRLGFYELLAVLLSDALIYGILIVNVMSGMSVADFMMYLTATVTLSTTMKTFFLDVSLVMQEGQYAHDFFRLMDEDLGEKGGERDSIVEDTLEIEFKEVSFKYPGTEHYILKDFNFKIHKGEKLAIVGVNGAGKSTIVKLITGMFEPTSGEIYINQIPAKEFKKSEYYKMFSVVFQEVNILAYTIRENVACSFEGIEDEKVLDCLTRVGLSDKIKSLDKGIYQSMLKIIEADGVEFSGGESQKLAIARALYKDGAMVILDEPTAALDALAEADIYQSFNDLVKDKTAVYISHRLASTKFCDKIALFDSTGLKEYGTHEQLMKQKGEYYRMFTVQGKYYQEGAVINE